MKQIRDPRTKFTDVQTTDFSQRFKHRSKGGPQLFHQIISEASGYPQEKKAITILAPHNLCNSNWIINLV